jgi:hypothetical protein
MKPPDQVPLLHRAILAFVIIVLVLFILALIGWLSGGWEEAAARTAIDEPPVSKYEEHLLAMDREALDKAYKDHIGLVFGVWMKGPTDPESPRRAGAGARNARQGYDISMERIEARERKLKEK